MKCGALTGRLNCGCCGDVRLDCDLDDGHEGPHHTTLHTDPGGVPTPIRWSYAGEHD